MHMSSGDKMAPFLASEMASFDTRLQLARQHHTISTVFVTKLLIILNASYCVCVLPTTRCPKRKCSSSLLLQQSYWNIFSRNSNLTRGFWVVDILCQVVDILKELWIYCNQIENQNCGYTAQSCGYTVNISKQGQRPIDAIAVGCNG